MHYFQAVILGIVEGFTEFLPISSTAHLVFVGKLLGLADSDFTKSFEIVIQLGSILAVAIFYAKRILTRKSEFVAAVVGFIPTGIVGLLVYPVLKKYLLGNLWLIVGTLFFGGIVFLLVERFVRRNNAQKVGFISYADALWIGVAQCLSIVPGVSRSGATIAAALLLGYTRATALQFSFLLALPTMAAATGLELIKNIHLFSRSEVGFLAVGFALAFVTGLVAIRWFTGYVQSHTFRGFAWYRIVLAVLVALYLAFGF